MLTVLRKTESNSSAATGVSASSHHVRIPISPFARNVAPALAGTPRSTEGPPSRASYTSVSTCSRCWRTSGQPPRRLTQRAIQIRVLGRVSEDQQAREASGNPASATVAFDENASRISSSKLERNRSSLWR